MMPVPCLFTLIGIYSEVHIILLYALSRKQYINRNDILLFQEGLILVGGNKPCETSISLSTLAAKQQSIVGVPRGNMNQLIDLLNAVADKEVNRLSLFLQINVRYILIFHV